MSISPVFVASLTRQTRSRSTSVGFMVNPEHCCSLLDGTTALGRAQSHKIRSRHTWLRKTTGHAASSRFAISYSMWARVRQASSSANRFSMNFKSSGIASTPNASVSKEPVSSVLETLPSNMAGRSHQGVTGNLEAIDSVASDAIRNPENTAADFTKVPSLAQSVEILEQIRQSARNAVRNKHRCSTLATKVESLFHLIKTSSTGISQSSLYELVEQMNDFIRKIEKDVREWSQYNLWTSWRLREKIKTAFFGHEALLKDMADRVQLTEIRERVGKLQETLKESAADTKEHKEAQEQLYDIRRKDTVRELRLPPCLEGECVKIGTEAVVSGSRFEIWEGQWLGRIHVALKSNPAYRVDVRGGKDDRMRFERQVNIWRRFDSPYVLKLFGWVKLDDGDVCLVSPWMKNGNINMYLDKKKPDTQELIRLITEIAKGLQYLHKRGHIHGSLQPSNILVDDNGIPVLSDFALSKPISPHAMHTQSNRHATDFRYHAPETDVDDHMSTANDVYSWGMSALEIVSGIKPYAHIDSVDGLLTAISEEGMVPDPEDHKCDAFETYDALWALLRSCWYPAKQKRPTLDKILEDIGEMQT